MECSRTKKSAMRRSRANSRSSSLKLEKCKKPKSENRQVRTDHAGIIKSLKLRRPVPASRDPEKRPFQHARNGLRSVSTERLFACCSAAMSFLRAFYFQ